jgi:DNA end-binding protein Ku
MPRSTWKGYLKLSLVSCAVALYNATSTSERVTFNTLNRKTGNRLKQQMIDSVTGDVVDPSDRVKGYQFSKDHYVTVEDEDLEALKIESTKLIEIEEFVPHAEVDQTYLDSPYYLTPDDQVAQEAFAVIREAMAAKEMVGIGRVVLNRRERMLMLEPRGKGIMATTLRYPYEVRLDAEYFNDIPEVKLPDEMLNIAEVIIERKSGHFDPAKFTDRYEEAVVNLVKAKQAGQVIAAPEVGEPSKVVNIMDALKRSLEAEGIGAADVRRPRAPSRKPAAAKAPAAAEEVRKPRARKAR